MHTSAASVPPGVTSSSPRRFLSVDALRGFDMLWIVGGGGLLHAANRLAGEQKSGLLPMIAGQLEHKEWEGFAFYDLIFPLFVFLVGVSVVFSLSRAKAAQSGTVPYGRIFKRFVLLYLVALFYSGGFSKLWPEIRLMGVLNRIALCYLGASLAFCHLRLRGLLVLLVSILVGYWALLSFLPFQDLRPRGPNGEWLQEHITTKDVKELNWSSTNQVHGVFEPGFNLTHYVDQKYLPGKKWDGTWDPEGFLSTLPAIGTCLLGVLAGMLLMNPHLNEQTKVQLLMGAGVVSVLLGFLWGMQFPVIKKIWTSSYVLVAGGYSALLLGAFHQMIEVWEWKSWITPFLWVGSNSITIYLANNLLGFGTVAKRFVGGDVGLFLDEHIHKGMGDLVVALVAIGIGLTLVRFLYRRNIFLRL